MVYWSSRTVSPFKRYEALNQRFPKRFRNLTRWTHFFVKELNAKMGDMSVRAFSSCIHFWANFSLFPLFSKCDNIVCVSYCLSVDILHWFSILWRLFTLVMIWKDKEALGHAELNVESPPGGQNCGVSEYQLFSRMYATIVYYVGQSVGLSFCLLVCLSVCWSVSLKSLRFLMSSLYFLCRKVN